MTTPLRPAGLSLRRASEVLRVLFAEDPAQSRSLIPLLRAKSQRLKRSVRYREVSWR